MRFLDTNVILRYVLADDAHKAGRCERLWNRIAHGEEPVITHVLAIAEAVWVLTGRYELPKEQVVDALLRLLALDGFVLEDKDQVLWALGLYRSEPVDFIDAYHAAFMRGKRLKTVYSYDKHFDLIEGVHRIEP